ncbi:hypothetical protein FA15DRAFT_675637 [Coprinopsis marcescibilis]|uniref:Uncharacterized protein n=1 Tax=Coprinopsis marcescibilis TaxID=230819 RepID=A0A5C3KDD6_COPMA|nr:hypothetical protein FA15DRAFT_675637 [Coprinopsis marcescibilis]
MTCCRVEDVGFIRSELDFARPQGVLMLFAHVSVRDGLGGGSSHLSMISCSGAFGMCSTTELSH